MTALGRFGRAVTSALTNTAITVPTMLLTRLGAIILLRAIFNLFHRRR